MNYVNHQYQSRRDTKSVPVAKLNDAHVRIGDAHILRGINLCVDQGERLLISGASGSGKSTLIRSLVDVTGNPLSQGTRMLFGEAVDDDNWNDRRRAALIARMIGVGYQQHNLDDNLPIIENLIDLSEGCGVGETIARAAEIACQLGLGRKLQQNLPTIASLSGGEKQRVALGRLLVPRPKLIVLDEPTGQIDSAGKRDVLDALIGIMEQDATLIMVSHDDEARCIATREIVIDAGRIALSTVLTRPD